MIYLIFYVVTSTFHLNTNSPESDVLHVKSPACPLSAPISSTIKTADTAARSAQQDDRGASETQSCRGGSTVHSRPLRLTTIAGPLCFRYVVPYTAPPCCHLYSIPILQAAVALPCVVHSHLECYVTHRLS
jgi:hypothetical protein